MELRPAPTPRRRGGSLNFLARLATGFVVIFSTHIVEDIANTCHDMAVLHQGQVRFRGSPQALIEAAVGQAWELEIPPDRSPDPGWHIVSQMQSTDSLRLRVVGHLPGVK